MVVNALAGLFHPGGLGLRDPHTNPASPSRFSLLCIVIAAANLIVDFDMIEQSVRRGTDEKFGWYLSFGMLVTLVWLYLEILRLLSYLQAAGATTEPARCNRSAVGASIASTGFPPRRPAPHHFAADE